MAWVSEKQQEQIYLDKIKNVRKLKHRNNNYFNTNDYFIFKNSLGQTFSTRLEKSNNLFFGLNYKMTSVLSINSNEI